MRRQYAVSGRRTRICLLHSAYCLLPLHFMQSVGALALAILLQLDLLDAAGDFDFRAVVEVLARIALQPHHFPVLFRHRSHLYMQYAAGSGRIDLAATTPTAYRRLPACLTPGS